MDIKVTKVEPMYIKEIDRKALDISKKIGRNFSRNEYIKMLIQNDAELRLIELKEKKFDEAIKNFTIAMTRQEEHLKEFINSNNRLFHLIASGEDIYEGGEESEADIR